MQENLRLDLWTQIFCNLYERLLVVPPSVNLSGSGFVSGHLSNLDCGIRDDGFRRSAFHGCIVAPLSKISSKKKVWQINGLAASRGLWLTP
jgi:hypothetical protein